VSWGLCGYFILKNKANFLLCLLFITVFKLRAYVSSVPFGGYEKQTQSKPIYGELVEPSKPIFAIPVRHRSFLVFKG
jgi:hypothetical protein